MAPTAPRARRTAGKTAPARQKRATPATPVSPITATVRKDNMAPLNSREVMALLGVGETKFHTRIRKTLPPPIRLDPSAENEHPRWRAKSIYDWLDAREAAAKAVA